MTEERIVLARPDLSGNEEAYVREAIRSSWISSTGPFVNRFEAEFAQLCETQEAVATSNGTVALQLALLALGAKSGDEVIVPSLTYVATANAVRHVSGEPIFVDVDPATWCLDPAKIETAITPRTKGIIAVHLYGHPADMDAIKEVAEAHGLWLIEDAAEAPLATYKGRPTGGLGTIGTFSFYGNKIFSSGEGGAITLSDHAIASHARLLRGQGMDPSRRYFFPIVGHNFRLTNVACALLCAQIERRDAFLERRRAIYALYRELLSDTPGIGLQPVAPWAELSPWLFCITIEPRRFGCTRDELMARLAEEGIETRPFFIPLHSLPPYRNGFGRGNRSLAVTEDLAERGLNLPTHTGLTDEQVERVCLAILAHRSQH